MTKKRLNNLLYIPAIVLAAIAGFMREKIFYELNARIKFLDGTSYDHNDPEYVGLYEGMSIAEINNEKWAWTIFFALFYFTLGAAVFKYIVKRNDMVRILAYLYIALAIISAVFYLGGAYLTEGDTGYRISRVFMGFLQSPIPLLILFPAQFIKKQ